MSSGTAAPARLQASKSQKPNWSVQAIRPTGLRNSRNHCVSSSCCCSHSAGCSAWGGAAKTVQGKPTCRTVAMKQRSAAEIDFGVESAHAEPAKAVLEQVLRHELTEGAAIDADPGKLAAKPGAAHLDSAGTRAARTARARSLLPVRVRGCRRRASS